MIKIDVISGFLGAGKTTLIKYLAGALSEAGEKTVIIENEFGQIGIDGKILEGYGFPVYEISSGCICCSLKSDFEATIVKIAEKIIPDRIIIEPSGIFVPSELFDLLKNPIIASKCEFNSIVAVIDCINFLKQRKKYSLFFESQIKYATSIALSKTGSIAREVLAGIIEELQSINPRAPIKAASWPEMGNRDFLEFIEKTCISFCKDSGPGTVDSPSHLSRHDFAGFSVNLEGRYTKEAIEEKLRLLSHVKFGNVIRAKGFIQSSSGFLQFSFVNGRYEISETAAFESSIISFIGENLNKPQLKAAFL